jgi:hypothetical protein
MKWNERLASLRASGWKRVRRVGAAVGVAAIALASPFTAASPASATDSLYRGEALLVIYNNSPLRWCPGTNCAVMAWMPASTGYGPGGGWVTLTWDGSSLPGDWCEVNWRGDIGWTGCWRLAVLV